MTRGRDRDVAVRKITVPPETKLNESFDILVHYKFAGRRPGERQPGKLRLYRNRRYLGDLDVDLEEGENVLRIPQKIRPAEEKAGEGAGFYQYEAVIETARDSVTENNQAFGYTHVAGEARVLLVEGKPGEAEALQKVLRAGGVKNLEVRPPSAFPTTMTDLQLFDAVILSDVRAENFSAGEDGQMKLLHDCVESHGGGLVMVGGDQSFGVGGYFRTPVEEALPVSMDIRKKKMRASMALVIAIDQSGSMTATVPGGQTKIELANEAACQVVDLLDDEHQLGVVYVDTSPMWAKKIGPIGNRGGVKADIRRNRGGGGGIYVFTAIDAAYKALDGVEATIKHIILFSDAADSEQPDGCVERARKELAKGRTLTVIGMGTPQDVDARFLVDLSKAGNGRIYFTEDVRKLPRIFTEDTLIASKSAIVEKTFKPELTAAAAMLEGIDWRSVPSLHGYVTTTLKPRGEMLLKGLEDDPVLAKWQHGLGRSVAFTSDAKPRWGKDWLEWEGFRNLWPQVVRWVSRRRAQTDFRTQVAFEGGKGRVVVDAFDAGGEAQNFLDLEARVSTSDGKTSRLKLTQQGTGRYEADFPADGRGVYFATVADREGGIVGQAGAAVSYSPEFELRDYRKDLLEDASRLGGGKVLAAPRGIFEHRAEPARSAQEAWRLLLGLAVALLMVDVTCRRLGIPELAVALARRLARRPAGAARPAEPLPEPIARLKSARDGARERTVQAAAPIEIAPAVPSSARPDEGVSRAAEGKPVPAPEAADGYLGRLLDAKKKARGEK
jgi:uncharacterized membrane protein